MSNTPYTIYNFPSLVTGDTSPRTEFVVSEADEFNILSGTDISFTAPNQINSVTTDLTTFRTGTFVNVVGSALNAGRYRVIGSPAPALTTVQEQTLQDEVAGENVTLSGNVPIDLTGASIRMYLRNPCSKTPEPEFTFSTDAGTIVIVSAESGIFRLEPQEMSLEPAQYNYSIELTLSDGTVRTIVAGVWRIVSDPTT